MTETAHASGEALDGERLLVQILSEARDDDGQLWALHRAIEAAVALPLDVHVVGEPLVIVAVEYDGNARRGLVARCRREDGSEYRIGLADVEMPARTPAARHAAAYRSWLGMVPDAGASATTPRSRQHKAGDDDVDLSRPVELVVLAVNERAARCRLLGSGRVITLRAGSLYGIVAGHIVTVAPNKHWRHAGHPYLSGQIAGTRIDARALGLVPLALRAAANVWDAGGEGRSAPDGRPRSAFELEVPPIPTGLAAAQIDDPDVVAEKLLEADLRFLDAHAYLADRLLGMSPQWAVQQYEVGVGIGQLSVGDDFDGVLRGELAGNRGLLRCLSGYGSCLWRLERRDEAARVLERVLRLDPADRQGVRPLLSAMRAGAPWSDEERS